MQETQETWVQSLGWEDPPEEKVATHSSIFALKIPWTEELGRLQSTVLQRAGYSLVTECACILMLKVFIYIFFLFSGTRSKLGRPIYAESYLNSIFFMLNFVRKMEFFNIQILLLHEENDNKLTMFTVSPEKNFKICIIPNMPQY